MTRRLTQLFAGLLLYGISLAAFAFALVGFGSILIERSLDKVMGSSVKVEYLPAGLTAIVRLPLDQIGLTYLAVIPWTLKFLWAPAVERYRLPPGVGVATR